jgi:hypothetical protein
MKAPFLKGRCVEPQLISKGQWGKSWWGGGGPSRKIDEFSEILT